MTDKLRKNKMSLANICFDLSIDVCLTRSDRTKHCGLCGGVRVSFHGPFANFNPPLRIQKVVVMQLRCEAYPHGVTRPLET